MNSSFLCSDVPGEYKWLQGDCSPGQHILQHMSFSRPFGTHVPGADNILLVQVIQQMDVGPGGRSSQLSASVRQNGAELVLQLACWTAATGQGIRADITGTSSCRPSQLHLSGSSFLAQGFVSRRKRVPSSLG